MIGKALYTINKEAKRLRDLKYAAADFLVDGYTDNEKLIEYLESNDFELDENGKKVVYDQYDRAFYDLDAIQKAIKETYSNPLDEDEESIESDIEDLTKCSSKLKAMIEKERVIAHDLKEFQEYYYEMKAKVLKKLSLKPIAYHNFHGLIMALYEYEGFKFHLPVDELPEDADVDAELDWIDSENKLEEPLSLDEANKILRLFLSEEN